MSMGEGRDACFYLHRGTLLSVTFVCNIFFVTLGIMSIIILEVHPGKGRNRCPLDGRSVAIRGVEFITSTTTQGVPLGSDPIQKDYSTSSTGKARGSTSFNRGTKGSSIPRYVN